MSNIGIQAVAHALAEQREKLRSIWKQIATLQEQKFDQEALVKALVEDLNILQDSELRSAYQQEERLRDDQVADEYASAELKALQFHSEFDPETWLGEEF